jgi:hypothetical protein
MRSEDEVAKNERVKLNLYGKAGRFLFFFGSAVAGLLFFLIQILNSYPFWDYINGYRLTLGPLIGVYGDITYLPWPLHFVRVTQVFDVAVALVFVGLFVWKLADSGMVNRRNVAAAAGYTSLVTGTICAVIVYLQIDVLTGTNLPWGSYSWGTERVAYNTQFLGAEYNCTFLNYTQLLYIAVAMAAAGFLLWSIFSRAEAKTPAAWVTGVLFAVSFALLVSGLMLVFPGEKFSQSDPSMPATPYAVQGVMILWTGAVLFMVSLVELYSKAKRGIDMVRSHFAGKTSEKR